jgi:hypothetical protein
MRRRTTKRSCITVSYVAGGFIGEVSPQKNEMNIQLCKSRMYARRAIFYAAAVPGNDQRLIQPSHDAAPEAHRRPDLRARLPLLALFGSAALLCMGIAHAASTSAEQNWPQWRGPHGTGVAPQADPPTEWNETKNVK